MHFLNRLRQYRKSKSSYHPLIEVYLSKQNLLHNFHIFQVLHKNVHVAPILKSNAYGHGLIPIAEILQNTEAPFFIVDSLFEAKMLRHHGIKKPLLILGYTSIENIQQNTLSKIVFTITSLSELSRLAQTLRVPRVIHLKIDTGMHRQGILTEEVFAAIKIIKDHPRITLEGICSHFSDSDGPDPYFTAQQITTWKNVTQLFREHFPQLPYFHLSNSAGAMRCDADIANVVRLGMGLYGINPPNVTKLPLRPVLEIRTRIASIKTIGPNEGVGYNNTFITPHAMTIAMIPLGYFEGVDRRLSNCGTLLVRNIPCPIVGRVSMNMTTIDVSNLPGASVGDPVVVISNREGDKNSVEYMARLCHTDPREILIHIPQHIRRIAAD